MPTNRAAWQPAKVPSLDARSAPYAHPSANGITIKNAVVIINLVNWLVQEKGDIMFTWLKYPFTLGSDVIGEVVEVGSNVTRFQTGDRIVGFARGKDQKVNTQPRAPFRNTRSFNQIYFHTLLAPYPMKTLLLSPLACLRQPQLSSKQINWVFKHLEYEIEVVKARFLFSSRASSHEQAFSYFIN